MANYIFEQITAAQAASFDGAADQLFFINTAPSDLTITYNPANGLTNASITVSGGGHSATFVAGELSNDNITFLGADTSGQLYLGTEAGDTLTATAATDDGSFIYGFAGADVISVGDGADVLSAFVDGGEGADTITATGVTDLEGDGTSSFNIYGGLGADVITVDGGFNHIYGYAAGTGDANDGGDTITATDGSNYIQGNAGNDVISVSGGDDEDFIYANRVQGGAGNDTITVGTYGANAVNGNKGNDVIIGEHGDSLLRGGQGNDTITAGDGHDTVMGDAGNDLLHAGDSNTAVLTGGAGNDVFDIQDLTFVPDEDVATLPVGVTEITDFSAGDTLDIGLGAAVDDDAVVYSPEAVFTTLGAAHTYAVTALAAAGVEVASIAVGADTYVFFNGGDSVVKLDNYTATNITGDSFVG